MERAAAAVPAVMEIFRQQGFKYAAQIGTLVGGEPRITCT